MNYGKCYKISNIFLIMCSNKILVSMAVIQEDPDETSLIWVCPICLGSFRQTTSVQTFRISSIIPF